MSAESLQNYLLTHITKNRKCVNVLVTDVPPRANQVSVQIPHLRVFFQYYTTYTNTTEGCPMERGDDCPLSTNCSTYIPLCPSDLHQEAKSFLVTRSYYTVNEPNIHLRGIARLKENKWE
jgi:hypothetical protein